MNVRYEIRNVFDELIYNRIKINKDIPAKYRGLRWLISAKDYSF